MQSKETYYVLLYVQGLFPLQVFFLTGLFSGL